MCDRSDFISNDFRSREIQRVFVRVFCAAVQWASRRWIKVCLFDWKFTSINTAVLYCGHYISCKNTGWLPNLYHCISILSCLFISIVQTGFVELFTVVSSYELELHCWLRTAWLVFVFKSRVGGRDFWFISFSLSGLRDHLFDVLRPIQEALMNLLNDDNIIFI